MKNDFAKILAVVQGTPEWKAMADTTENSPYHREDSVAIHTMMTLDAYDRQIVEYRTERQKMITRLALVFHDFGKPDAEETLDNADGTTRRRYAGHELISANSFVDFVTSHPDITSMIYEAGLVPSDLHAIRFMIEHHLPYGLKKQHKRETLKFNLVSLLGDDLVCFYDMLLSDSRGRISDNQEEKLAAVDEWIAEFKQVLVGKPVEINPDAPFLYILMGTSGSGKSTWTTKAMEANPGRYEHFSLDIERQNFARAACQGPELGWLNELQEKDPRAFYDTVYDYCSESNKSKFKAFANAVFEGMVKDRKNIIVDNMNIAKKGRSHFINTARQAGYNVVAVEFWVPLQTVLDRQHTRADKTVPHFAVRHAYLNQQIPLLTCMTTDLTRPKVNPEGEINMAILVYNG